MTVILPKAKVLGFLLAFFTIHSASSQSIWNQLGSDIEGTMGDGQGTSVSLSSDGLTMATGATSGPNASLKGIVRVYTYDGSSWNQKGADINGEADGDSFGSAVSLSDDGNLIAIGAFTKDLTASMAPNGRVQVYEWNGSAWVQRGSNIDGIADFENLGEALALSGNGTRLAVGVPGKDTNGVTTGGETGTVQVYEFTTDWTLLGAEIPGVEDLSAFGSAVSLDQTGTALAVGATSYTGGGASSIGQVRTYRYNGSAWEAKGSTKSTFDGTGNQVLGSSVSLSNDGDRLAIGAPTDFFGVTNIGSVQVWDYASENWTQVGSDINSNLDGDAFGQRIELSGDGTHFVVGATNYLDPDNKNGHAQVWKLNVDTWDQVDVTLTGEADSDAFGTSVAISNDGSMVGIGAPVNAGGGADAGHVRVYEFGVANVAPMITASQSFSVDENVVEGTIVGTAQATDINVGTTFSDWTITAGNDANNFLIDSGTGTITVGNSPSLDFETTPSYTLTLTVSDGMATSSPETVTISINDIDEIAPTVSISSSESTPTNAETIPITITFSEDVTGFVEGDVVVTGGAKSNFSGSGSVYTVDVTPTTDGPVTVDIAAVVAQDAAGNDNTVAAQFSIVSDRTRPTTLIGSAENLSAINSDDPFTIKIAFDDDVNDFELSDINITNATADNFTSLGVEFIVNTLIEQFSVDITPDGTEQDITINISENVAQDLAGNDNTAAAQYSIQYDVTAPSLVITSSETSPSNAETIPITITFSEAVSGFAISDLSITNCTLANAEESDSTIFTMEMMPTADGTITTGYGGKFGSGCRRKWQ